MRRFNICALTLAILSGCGGEPRFDATNDATIKASVERMSAGLPQDRKTKFVQDVMLLSVRPAMGRAWKAATGGGPVANESASEMMKPLHGLTVAEINSCANAVRKQQEADDRVREAKARETVAKIDAHNEAMRRENEENLKKTLARIEADRLEQHEQIEAEKKRYEETREVEAMERQVRENADKLKEVRAEIELKKLEIQAQQKAQALRKKSRRAP